MIKNFLITGPPRSGKTTLIRRLSQRLADVRVGGFLTEEIRERGVRQGFSLESFQGKKSVLAHVSFPRAISVGKYGVDVAALNSFLSELESQSAFSLWIIDEIGRMECYSRKFIDLVKKLLDSPAIVVATVAFRGRGFIAEVKQRPDVKLFYLTSENREALVLELEKLVRKILAKRK